MGLIIIVIKSFIHFHIQLPIWYRDFSLSYVHRIILAMESESFFIILTVYLKYANKILFSHLLHVICDIKFPVVVCIPKIWLTLVEP